MTARGMNYWESKDGNDRRLIFSMNDYLQEIDARDRQVDPDLRQRTAWSTCVKDSAAIRPPSVASSRARPDRSSRT